MRYIFYGRHEVKNYRPQVVDYYGARVYSLGSWTTVSSREEFFRKDNVHAEIKVGQRIDINGESVYIQSIEYDIVEDSYKCYTNKVLSHKEGNMTKEQAEQKLEELQSRGLFGFFKELFGG